MFKSACERLCLQWHRGEAHSRRQHRSHYILRPNKICMDFGLNQNPVAALLNASNSNTFFLRSVADSLLKDTLSCRSHSMSRSLSVPLIPCFHFVCPDCADFQQLYCIIFTDKRFPFNINVKFIANIMQNKKKPKAFLALLPLVVFDKATRFASTHRERKRKQANRPKCDRRTN